MKPNPLIIAICGFKQSGKDTVATLLHNCINVADYTYVFRHGFAHKLKEEVAALLGTNVKHLDANKQHPLIRHIYQWYGTDYCRKEFGEDHWIKQTDEMVGKLSPKTTTCVIISDLRFPNEAEWVKSKGGVIVKVERAGQHLSDDMHPSEQLVLKIRPDFILYNNGKSIAELTREVQHIKTFVWEMKNIT